jgi:8-oxo-dGTP pyrophosphatase MutT (NUDIX family)
MVTIKNKRASYLGKILTIEEQDLDFENGNTATYEVVQFKVMTGVSALPVDGDYVYLIKHYMAGIEKEGYSLPTGGLNAGEDPVERMRLELMEELGMTASKIELMYRSDILPSYVGSESGYVFLAQDLTPMKSVGDEPYPIEVIKLSLQEALEKVKQNEIKDTRTIGALLYYHTFYR